jgi:DNA-binding NarL/FixJ family response regulator
MPNADRAAIMVVLADSTDNGRAALRAILTGDPGIRVAAETDDAAELQQLVTAHEPDVVALDIGLAGSETLALIEDMTAGSSRSRVVVLSNHNDSRYAVRALHAGASGYILKPRAHAHLIRAVCKVASNRLFVCPGVAGITLEERAEC